MARTIDFWYNEIISAKERQPALSGLDSTSKVSIFRLIAEVIAVVIWSLDQLHDLHRKEINSIIETKKPSRLQWYQDLALNFQYGQDLDQRTGKYDNSNLTVEQVAARKIVHQAAVTEISGMLRIKLATRIGNALGPLSQEQLNSFNFGYISRLKDAGVVVAGESLPPDPLRLELDIWYNPLVLRSDGKRIDGNSATPIKDAIVAYLRSLPFNGEYSNSKLTDSLQQVEGVVFPVIKNASARYGLLPFVSIDEKYIPDAGYLELTDSNLQIAYREYV
ncbi:nucleotidyltransferase [Chitinophaga sp. SYP-B3965]|uniref:nucleotidyltransferase n=1 Tax=Chitinophaga sp. SYP-B3965 TaxID=2663120 RepID=UPI001299E947|nr:nucleotidyltransferase [Chitinophaga sp. SYP-B3965]MRG45492.1 nucleotidyltransferase [Chitinophaga sp. SYP-B3965]